MVCAIPPLVALSLWLLWPDFRGGLEVGRGLFILCCAAMGASSFGNEFHWRTMPQLLAQPISRQRVWFEKLMALGIALFLAILLCLIVPTLIFFLYVWYLGSVWPVLNSETWNTIFRLFAEFIMISLCGFCTTPYLTLLARNTVGGLVFSFVIPLFILVATSFWEPLMMLPSTSRIYLVYIGYAALFYWLGYRKFLNLQVTDGIDQSIRLPRSVENAFAAPFRAMFFGHSGPIASLIKKEFRLQQISFVIAGLFCLLVLAACWVWRSDRDTANLLMVLVLPLLTFMLPLLVGALAIVEEKAWGLAEWHISLPASAWKQWLVKMAVTFSTSLTLGMILPILLLWVFRASTGSKEFDSAPIANSTVNIIPIMLLLFNLLLTGVAVYAASLSTNAIRAMFLAFGLGAAIVGAFNIGEAIGTGWGWFTRPTYFGVHSALFGEISEVVEWVIIFIQVYLLFYLFQRFAFSNFKRREATAGRAGVQMLALLFLIVMFVAIFSVPGYLR
jgi:ABC-type transport system involved in multi-copper enzyme maturation permease subunit